MAQVDLNSNDSLKKFQLKNYNSLTLNMKYCVKLVAYFMLFGLSLTLIHVCLIFPDLFSFVFVFIS